jgi:hypothetical protein
MNPTLAFRDQLAQIAQPLVDEFDQLIANIGTGWAAEHDADGHHTNITASGACACAQLKLRGLVTLDVSGGGATAAPLAVPAGVSVISLRTPLIGGLDVYGIQQVGQRYGDVLFLTKATNFAGGAISLRSLANSLFGAGSTPIGTEIVCSADPFVVSLPVQLIYLPYRGTGQTDAWVMHF